MAFTVGQLAKRTGLTVRALHYHAIGLLVPSHRSVSGYRLYTPADVVRLYQIQALRRLGLSLAEVDAVLDTRGASLPETVGRQIEELNDRIEHAEALKQRLVHLRDVLAQSGEPVVGDWLAAVEVITLYDRYCSPEELHRLLAYRRTGIEDWRALIADVRTALTQGVAADAAVRLQFSDDRLRDWLRVVAEMRDAMKSGREPDSDGVQLGLRQWDAFVDDLVKGDATLTRRVVEAFETDLELQQAWAVDAALLTFVNQARRSALRRGATHA